MPRSKRFHSNYEVRWTNYKRFEDTGWLTLRPLTILIGPNNSGKTSIISPLLLLSQTMSSEDAETPLVTRGSLVDLGSYRNLVHRFQLDREIFFGFRWHSHQPQAGKDLKEVGRYAPGAVQMAFGSGPKQTIRLRKYEILDLYKRLYFARERVGSAFSLKGVMNTAEMTTLERGALSADAPINFLFSPTTTLSRLKRPDEEEMKRPELSREFSHYIQAASYAFSSIREILSDMSYIGPLRERPRRFYRIPAETPRTVGPRGESAPHLFRAQPLTCQRAINEWVSRFDFGESLFARRTGEELFELKFRSGSESMNIADAGFGASQVLPLIVQAIAAPENSLTIAEQPEIHLNPRLQSLLADLFVQMAVSGHRVLVETHSEHLLVRLRTLVAERRISASDVGIYFVEKEATTSTVKEVPVQKDGSFPRDAWPRGFFDDALRESLALATAQARHRTEGVERKNAIAGDNN